MQIDQMKEEIVKLCETMEDLTLDSSVGAARYKELSRKLDKKKPETIERTYDFLSDVLIREYAEVERIWTLPTMTADVWFNYLNMFPDTDFEEVALLKIARKRLKKAYVEFFKSKNKKRKAESNAKQQSKRKVKA